MFAFSLVCAFLACVEAISWPTAVFGRPRGGFLRDIRDYTGPDGYPWTDSANFTTGTIDQYVDHFSSNSSTWKQRYQYNNKFYNPNNPLAFLMLGGEGQISEKWVRNENITMMVWAQEFQAAAFQVEHRFYGPKANSPKPDQTTESMKLLTIDQALADVKEFIKQMNAKYFSGKSVRWVTFGGSYPGSLSAWFRETYPDQTIGAVSTSSAVGVQVDYYGYAVNTEWTYGQVGTQTCSSAIGTAFANMQTMTYGGPAQRENLRQKLNLCESFDENNLYKSIQFFYSNVYGLFQGINQYTGDNRDNATANGLGVPAACKIMNNAAIPDPIDRVKAVWDMYNSYYPPETKNNCNPNSYTDFIQQISNTSYSDEGTVATRSWIWQTCTELGYFQTTDGGKSIFGSTVPLDFYTDQCKDAFGGEYDLDKTTNLVAAVRAKYGGNTNYRGTNVVFPNGSFDPWKSLGLGNASANANNNVVAFLMDGTAHCADMYPARNSDPVSLTQGRAIIHNNLKSWIDRTSSALSNTFYLLVITTLTRFIF